MPFRSYCSRHPETIIQMKNYVAFFQVKIGVVIGLDKG